MTTDLLNFDAALPTTDLHMVEASAGTGKTYTLSTLVTRYVVEQSMPISQLLLVTFTNEAASDLRHRVRSRLRSVLASLREPPPPDGDGDLEAHLRALPHDAEVLAKLHNAVNEFDQATITTIHAFSQQILRRAGLDDNPLARLRPDLATLEADIIADYLAAVALDPAHASAADIPMESDVLDGLRMARNHPGARLEPVDASERIAALEWLLRYVEDEYAGATTGDADEMLNQRWQAAGGEKKLVSTRMRTAPAEKIEPYLARQRLAQATARAVRHVEAAMAATLVRNGEVGFSDLLTKAAGLVADSDQLRSELAGRYSVIFVDEFQDTDPMQWSMLVQLADSPAPAAPAMIVVGDPKQAIYRFRGGDIGTYLHARGRAEPNLYELTTNYRSEAPLVAALNQLFRGLRFGPDIDYTPVTPSEQSTEGADMGDTAPLSFRLIDADVHRSRDAQRRAVAADLADQIVAARQNTNPPVAYKDMAVLYTAHSHAGDILHALAQRGVPAVVTRGESVLESVAIDYWRHLFWALERTSDTGRARAAAVTPLVGYTADQVAPDDPKNDARVRDLQARLRRLASRLETHGVADALRVVLRDWEGSVRLAAQPGGNRTLVDVEHIAELLQLAAPPGRVSPTALRELLDELVFTDPADVDYAAELTKRRLDSETDEDVVRLMSIHMAKGLEFDLVFCPTLWNDVSLRSPLQYSDGNQQVLHFSKKSDDAREREHARSEQQQEARRLAYVALTRAKRGVTVWWPAMKADAVDKPDRPKSGLGLLLKERGHNLLGASDNAPAVMRQLAVQFPDCFGFADVGATGDATGPQAPAPEAAADLGFRTFRGPLDRSADRLSFSRLTGLAFPYEDRARPSAVDPEADDDAGSQDENPDEVFEGAPPTADAEVPLAALPVGKDAGDRMHQIFEEVDFSLDTAERRTAIATQVATTFSGLDSDQAARAVDGLDQAMLTDLGPDLHNISLHSIGRADRLAEMSFELPLPLGRRAASLPKLGALLLEHHDPSRVHAELISEWAASLQHPKAEVPIGGFLTGSIDLLFRYETPEGHLRYVVADYKSNKVAGWDEPMTPEVYRTERLAHEMHHGHYLLQALLYLVATHRFLKLRIDGYDPDQHLGPAAYLFVRGMVNAPGPDQQPLGVFTWRPSTDLILAVEKLLLRKGRRG